MAPLARWHRSDPGLGWPGPSAPGPCPPGRTPGWQRALDVRLERLLLHGDLVALLCEVPLLLLELGPKGLAELLFLVHEGFVQVLAFLLVLGVGLGEAIFVGSFSL